MRQQRRNSRCQGPRPARQVGFFQRTTATSQSFRTHTLTELLTGQGKDALNEYREIDAGDPRCDQAEFRETAARSAPYVCAVCWCAGMTAHRAAIGCAG